MAKTPTQIASLARAHTQTALTVLASIMNQPDAPAAARTQAATALLDRGWGKPPQAIIGGEDGDPPVQVDVVIRRIIVDGHKDGGSVPPATGAG